MAERKRSTTRFGNKGDAGYAELVSRIGGTLLTLDRLLVQFDNEGVRVLSLSLRAPTEEKPDWLVTVRAETENGKIVAFNGGESFQEAVVGTINRIANRSLRWREDKW